MRDLRASRPDVIIDSTYAVRNWGAKPLSQFPELASYVREGFVMARRIELSSGSIDVYVRK